MMDNYPINATAAENKRLPDRRYCFVWAAFAIIATDDDGGGGYGPRPPEEAFLSRWNKSGQDDDKLRLNGMRCCCWNNRKSFEKIVNISIRDPFQYPRFSS